MTQPSRTISLFEYHSDGNDMGRGNLATNNPINWTTDYVINYNGLLHGSGDSVRSNYLFADGHAKSSFGKKRAPL